MEERVNPEILDQLEAAWNRTRGSNASLKVTSDSDTSFLVVQLHAHAPALIQAARERDQLRQALEWTEHNFRLAVQGKPVRDMTENLAFNRAILNDPTPSKEEQKG
jgi:hypothetical protein